MFDFHILLLFFLDGLYFCFKILTDATIFVVLYGLTSLYFVGVIVRLILVVSPAMCLISAIAISSTMKNLATLVHTKPKSTSTATSKGSSNFKASSKVRKKHLWYFKFQSLDSYSI